MRRRHHHNNRNQSQNRTQNAPARNTNRITEHFTKKDFMCRCGECSKSLKLSLGLVGGLELLRTKIKKHITILKGYECPDSAEKHKRIKRNFHTQGVAAIIRADQLDAIDLFRAAENIPEFKGLGVNPEDNTLYVDTRKEKERKSWIVIHNEEILITDENRATYIGIPTPLPDEQ